MALIKMKRVQKAATIIALATCFAIAIGGEFWEASHSPNAPQQRGACETTSKPQNEATKESPEKAIARYNYWLTWVIFILAVATVGLGIIGIYQIWLARVEFLSTHRPKIRLKHIWLTSDISQLASITVRLVCVNTGTADATLLQLGIRCHVEDNEYRLPADANIAATLALVGNSLPSGLNLTIPSIDGHVDTGRILAAHESTAVLHRRTKLYCVGWISYLDAAGRMRITGFCRVLDAPRGNALLTNANGRFRICEHPDYEYQD